MEIKLKFLITFLSGEQTEQEIAVPADERYAFDVQAKALMQTMLSQYASIGILRKGPTPDNPNHNYYKLVLPSNISTVECELPSIVIASEAEVSKIVLD